MIVLLDAGPLGWAANPHLSARAMECRAWMRSLLDSGIRVGVPEVADFEVRRELIRAGKRRGLQRLDDLKDTLLYAPLTTPIMLQAAEFWAAGRNAGRPTADPHDLDCDVILAAQAVVLAREEGEKVVIATTNSEHLSFFTPALEWGDVTPDLEG